MRPSGGLPAGRADLGRLDPVVGGVPDQVEQRIADLVQDRAVELDLLALDVEPDPLAQVARRGRAPAGESARTLRRPASSATRSPRPACPTPAARSGRSARRARGRRSAAAITPSRFLATTSSPTCFIRRSSRAQVDADLAVPLRRRPSQDRRPAPRTGRDSTSPAVRIAAASSSSRRAAIRSGSRAGRRTPRARAGPATDARRTPRPATSARRTARIARAPRITASAWITTWTERPRGASVERRRGGSASAAPRPAPATRRRRVAASSAPASIGSGAASRPAAACLDALAERVHRAEEQLERVRRPPSPGPGAARRAGSPSGGPARRRR